MMLHHQSPQYSCVFRKRSGEESKLICVLGSTKRSAMVACSSMSSCTVDLDGLHWGAICVSCTEQQGASVSSAHL
eukprot:2099631-Rhodomonas_salina.1